MKHYRTISFAKIFGIIGGLLISIAIFILTGTFPLSVFLDPDILSILFSVLAIFIYICFGDSHLLYMLRESAGYKFFRSVPDAPRRFRKYCEKNDIFFLAIGIIIFIPSIMSGFSELKTLLFPSLYMICFGIQHIIVALFGFSTKLFLIEKGASSIIITLTGLIIIASSKYQIFNNLSFSERLLIAVLSTLTAVIGSAVLNSKIEKKWLKAE